MSGGARLQIALRRAVSTLRQLADSLESALEEESHEERPRSTSGSTSRAPDWDLLSDPPASTAAVQPSPGLEPARTSPNAGYDEVARLLTKAPQHCFDLCNRLSGTSEFVKFRVQRAWEAGLWARAVVEGKIPKPRPTPKIEVRTTTYIVVRGAGLRHPVRVSSAAAYYQLVPRFTEDSLSHGFPSVAEATVYCLALGIDLPAEQ